MKKYEAESGVLYVGEYEEMRQIYKSIDRANRNLKTWLSPFYLNFPIFRSDALAGIIIDESNYFRMIQGDRLVREMTGIWA